MKKIFLSFSLFALTAAAVHAQAPARFNYQGIARNSAGAPLASQAISLRLTVLDGSATGPVVYQETHSITTNAYGLYNVAVGGGTALAGFTLGSVNWASGDKYIKVEADPAGGTSYTALGTTQLLSVPYALYASSGAGAQGPAGPAGPQGPAGASGATYTAGTGIAISGTNVISAANLAGDVTGAPGANTVAKIRGVAVSTTAPLNGQVLQYNGTQYAPVTPAAGGGSLSGTTNYLVKFTSATAGGNSALYETGGKVGLGTATAIPAAKLQVRTSTDSVAALIQSAYAAGASNGVLKVQYTGNSNATHIGILSIADSVITGTSGIGVEGIGSNSGMLGIGQSTSTATNSQTIGVEGDAIADADVVIGVGGFTADQSSVGGLTAVGVYGNSQGSVNTTTAYAGYFDGNVNVAGNLSKTAGTFKIDDPIDPANKYLYHSFVESPDMMNVYNGNITTDANGNATVTLPAYFDALNKDFRYQLTVLGKTFAQAIVSHKVQGNAFAVKTSQPNIEVSWQVTGVRKDAYANAHRVVPEVEKESFNKGKYISPVELGLSADLKILNVKSARGNTGSKADAVQPRE